MDVPEPASFLTLARKEGDVGFTIFGPVGVLSQLLVSWLWNWSEHSLPGGSEAACVNRLAIRCYWSICNMCVLYACMCGVCMGICGMWLCICVYTCGVYTREYYM